MTRNYARVLDLVPNGSLSDDALRGWARFYGSIASNVDQSAKYTTDLVKVFGGVNNFDRAGLEAVMKQLSEVGHNGFKLTLESGSTTKWRSPAGLIYKNASDEGHRLTHVLSHTVPGYNNKPIHTVFSGGRGNVLPLVDEAWLRKGSPDVVDGGRDKYKIAMDRQVGGDPEERYIYIIVDRANSEIVSAFPVKAAFIPK